MELMTQAENNLRQAQQIERATRSGPQQARQSSPGPAHSASYSSAAGQSSMPSTPVKHDHSCCCAECKVNPFKSQRERAAAEGRGHESESGSNQNVDILSHHSGNLQSAEEELESEAEPEEGRLVTVHGNLTPQPSSAGAAPPPRHQYSLRSLQ